MTLRKSFPVFDCDAHINDPIEIWSEYVEPEYRDLVMDTYWKDNKQSLLNGRTRVPGAANYEFADWSYNPASISGPGMQDKRVLRRLQQMRTTPEQKDYLDHKGAYESHARLRVMDLMGIDQVVIIPSMILNNLNLAFGCDLVLASESARFGEVFVRRAVPIDTGGTWLLPRLIGLQKAKELAFFGDWVSAQEAQKIGLVNRVYPADKLDAEVRSWAQRLAEGPALALSLIKMGLNRSFETSLADTLDNEALALSFCTTTDDFREAMRVFPDKKTPRFGRP